MAPLIRIDPVSPSVSHSSVGKESAWKAGDPGLIPGLGRSPGEGKEVYGSFLMGETDWGGN